MVPVDIHESHLLGHRLLTATGGLKLRILPQSRFEMRSQSAGSSRLLQWMPVVPVVVAEDAREVDALEVALEVPVFGTEVEAVLVNVVAVLDTVVEAVVEAVKEAEVDTELEAVVDGVEEGVDVAVRVGVDEGDVVSDVVRVLLAVDVIDDVWLLVNDVEVDKDCVDVWVLDAEDVALAESDVVAVVVIVVECVVDSDVRVQV